MQNENINGEWMLSRRGASGSKKPDEKLIQAVNNRCLVEYVDEWLNHRTMEARAYGLSRGEQPVVIGYQIDGDQGIAPEQMWKTIDDIERIVVKDGLERYAERTIPPQHTGQILKLFALAPDTGLDLTAHAADGY
jgi:hypothetical protein